MGKRQRMELSRGTLSIRWIGQNGYLLRDGITEICINGSLGNMNVEEAVKLTERIAPCVGIPTHYGMFESNTEDPQNTYQGFCVALK